MIDETKERENDARSDQCIVFKKGDLVERDLDGMWFPAKIINVHLEEQVVDVEYEEDDNFEADVPLSEVRIRLETNNSSDNAPVSTSRKNMKKKEMLMFKESLLLQDDYDPNKVPTVVIHNRGEVASSAGYIINGLENNTATGNGLRGIRWLRVHTGE